MKVLNWRRSREWRGRDVYGVEQAREVPGQRKTRKKLNGPFANERGRARI
jgi:hypothetical protein